MGKTMNYYQALQSRKPVTAIPPHATKESVLAGITRIGEMLKGPLPDTERIMLVHDRKGLQDILALMEKVAT